MHTQVHGEQEQQHKSLEDRFSRPVITLLIIPYTHWDSDRNKRPYLIDYVTTVAAVSMMYKPEQKSANLKSQAFLNSDGIQTSDVVIGQMWP